MRFFPVSQHELWAAHDQLARLAGGKLVAEFVHDTAFSLDEGLADGVWAVEFGVEISDVGDWRSFGHAVSLADEDAGEGGKAASELRSERRGAGFDPTYTMFFGKLTGFSGLAHSQQGRWDSRHHGDAFLRQ